MAVGATLWFCLMLVRGAALATRSPRRALWPPVVLLLGGSLVDTALAPTGTLVGPTLVAAWFTLTASTRAEAASLGLLTTVFAGATTASLAGHVGEELALNDGGIARSVAFGLLLVTAGLFGAGHDRLSLDRTRSGTTVV